MTEATPSKGRIRRAFKPAITWLVIFAFLMLIANVVIYNGFFIGIPSSAISLWNYDDLEKVKTWNLLKSTYPALDPQNLPERYDITVNITSMNPFEEFTRPKEFLLFHVKIKTDLDKRWFKLPSVFVLLLDQNDRIRGKLYVQQTSEDFFLTGNSETEYTFYFPIPSNMRGQHYRVVAELFGVIDNNKEIDYSRIKPLFVDPQPFVEHDDYYGSLPSWYYKEDSITGEYRYLEFLAFSQIESTISELVSIYGLALYAWTITGIIITFSTVIVLARQKIKSYYERNKILVTYAILFAIFLAIFFIVLVLMH